MGTELTKQVSGKSNHKGVDGIGSGRADLDELRQLKLKRNANGVGLMGSDNRFPAIFQKLGPLPLASHLISVIEGECRPIDPTLSNGIG